MRRSGGSSSVTVTLMVRTRSSVSLSSQTNSNGYRSRRKCPTRAVQRPLVKCEAAEDPPHLNGYLSLSTAPVVEVGADTRCIQCWGTGMLWL